MNKLLNYFLKFLVIILCLAIVLLVIIFVTRKYNERKYSSYRIEGQATIDPTDLSAYKTDIEGVDVTRIVGDYLNGFRLTPENKIYEGVIITFGGSEGSPAYDSAQSLAKDGYEVLALFFFGMDNQTTDLVQVPLDFFDEVLTYINNNIRDGDVITLYGGSKGAELALTLATYYPQINHLILMAPSAWNYMGLPEDFFQEMKSSWTYEDKELPYIDMTKGNMSDGWNLFLDFVLNRPIAYRDLYEGATLNDPQSEVARIKVENTEADILIFAGGDDQMWHADRSAQKIQEVRPENTEVHLFAEAGHVFELDRYLTMNHIIIEMGGNLEANQKALQESHEIILERLKQWHGTAD